MPLYTRKEFAAACGISENALSVYAGPTRKKIILSGDYIDDSIAQNAEFLALRKIKLAKKEVPVKEKKSNQLSLQDPEITGSSNKEVKDPVHTDSSQGLNLLTKEKLASENEKRQQEIELLKLKKDKQLGLVIPTALVKTAFKACAKTQVTHLHNALDDVLTKLTKSAGLNRNVQAELRGEIIKSLNHANEAAILEGIRSIDVIIEEYSTKKNVGERD